MNDQSIVNLGAKLLEMAADEFGNHGCNDFDLVKDGGMTQADARAFIKAYHDWNGDPEEFDGDETSTWLADFACMAFMAHLIRESVE